MWVLRDTNAARRRLDGDVIGAAVAFDIEFLDLEGLRVRGARNGNSDSEETGKGDQQVFGHDWAFRSCGV
jgi:hypothetical protein